jgi:hypothetical protein
MRGYALRSIFGLSVIAGVAVFNLNAFAISILGLPTFEPATNAPLAGTLYVTTDVPSRVSVAVDDGVEPWERDFFDYGTSHALTLLGFKINRTNEISVTVTDMNRNVVTAESLLTFVTGPLATNEPEPKLITNNPDLMEPGYTMFRVANNTTGGSWVMFVDSAGQIVWHSGVLSTPSDVRQLPNGDLFFPLTSTGGFEEANMLGQTVRTWSAAAGYPVDSHEDLITDHGTILYLSYAKELVANFPSSTLNSNAPLVTTNVSYDRVVEISETNSAFLNSWSLISMLDPTRINYLCYDFAFYGVDPEHANCVTEDENDGNSLIVSMRNQDAVVKFTREGQIKWILGPHNNWGPEWQPYLLTPVGTPFEWNYAQHAPILTPQGTLLMFDDGNCRAEPWDAYVTDQDNYSRAAEFSIDETNMTVTQVWQYANTNEDRLMANIVGNATMLPQTSNVLVTFGSVEYENGHHPSANATNASMIRLKEVTHEANPQVVFDLEIFDPTNTSASYAGYLVYRSRRVPDLYAHPAAPVVDLTVSVDGGLPLLQFSGDPYRNYDVQSSRDLVNWVDLGPPDADEANGEFSFEDEANAGGTAVFYRVLTQ